MSTVFPKFTEKSLELWVGIGKEWLGISSHMYLPCHTHPAPYMLKKTHIHLSTYKRPWPCVNITFRVIQTLFLHLTKGRFCFTSDKQTAFKGKLSHSYMRYSALETCWGYLEHGMLMKLTFSGMALSNVHIKGKWQWTALKKMTSSHLVYHFCFFIITFLGIFFLLFWRFGTKLWTTSFFLQMLIINFIPKVNGSVISQDL